MEALAYLNCMGGIAEATRVRISVPLSQWTVLMAVFKAEVASTTVWRKTHLNKKFNCTIARFSK